MRFLLSLPKTLSGCGIFRFCSFMGEKILFIPRSRRKRTMIFSGKCLGVSIMREWCSMDEVIWIVGWVKRVLETYTPLSKPTQGRQFWREICFDWKSLLRGSICLLGLGDIFLDR